MIAISSRLPYPVLSRLGGPSRSGVLTISCTASAGFSRPSSTRTLLRPQLSPPRTPHLQRRSMSQNIEVAGRSPGTYPPIEPYETGKLKVSDLHTL